MALNLPNRYPGRFSAPTTDYPQGSFKNRTAPGALDGSYLEKDWANDKEGFFQSLIAAAGIVPNEIADKVGASQYYDALLAVIADNNEDTLNTTRISIASAATVNLTTGAPNTRHLNITGTTSISAFTVAAGQCYFVRAGGAFTLTNSASLVTQTGANIVCDTGDTFVIRATAANTVEVMFYSRAVQLPIGVGQTWQDVFSSRAIATTYTNSTGRPIVVSVSGQGQNGSGFMLVVGSVNVARTTETSANGPVNQLTAVVPSGATYSVQRIGAATLNLLEWTELR